MEIAIASLILTGELRASEPLEEDVDFQREAVIHEDGE
jgi:hypothetical protein